ncbi:YfhO family protein [Candidatus Microgenomates bacterium]|nr:YfhO family protein [Candidatus Microgenomates bacterium]
MKKLSCLSFLLLLLTLVIFFYPVWLKKLTPTPTDALVGMYHPWRDLLKEQYPNGYPYKNFLPTDPFRQQIPWKKLAIEQLKNKQLPLWNPYNFSGNHLLANFQAGVFYPLNLIFFILPFINAWTIFIIIQPFLAALFLYLFLRHHKISTLGAVLASLAWTLGGYMLVWLEWGNVGHTALWLPLILLSIDKLSRKISKTWGLVFLFSLVSQFLAGHAQTSFMVILVSLFYFTHTRYVQMPGSRWKLIKLFAICCLSFAIITTPQWLPTIKFSQLSNRTNDIGNVLFRPDWFLPLEQLVQIITPDFFGHPSTQNYWGEWNYMEFVSYLGIVPLFFALLALTNKFKSKLKPFFITTLITSLLLALSNPISKLPFILKLPFLSSAQPSRWLFLTTFSLSILAALGFDYFIKQKPKLKKLVKPLLIIFIPLAIGWALTFINQSDPNWLVTRRNLILPTALFVSLKILLVISSVSLWLKPSRNLAKRYAIYIILLALASLDLLRFAWKFTPFSPPELFFPTSEAIEFLQQDKDIFRIMSTDSRLLTPNTSAFYQLEDIAGYDPLYFKTYSQILFNKDQGNYNRLIQPQNPSLEIFDQLNVKYVLSLSELNHQKLELVLQQGETRIYQNLSAYDRFEWFELEDHQRTVSPNQILVEVYQPGYIKLQVQVEKPAYLGISAASFQPWQVAIDGQTESLENINQIFAGPLVQAGKHMIEFKIKSI